MGFTFIKKQQNVAKKSHFFSKELDGQSKTFHGIKCNGLDSIRAVIDEDLCLRGLEPSSKFFNHIGHEDDLKVRVLFEEFLATTHFKIVVLFCNKVRPLARIP